MAFTGRLHFLNCQKYNECRFTFLFSSYRKFSHNNKITQGIFKNKGLFRIYMNKNYFENYFTSKGIQKMSCHTSSNLLLNLEKKNLEVESEDNKHVEETTNEGKKQYFPNGPGLEYFISNLNLKYGEQLSKRQLKKISHPYVPISSVDGKGRKVFFEVHGCQMNVNDADVAWSILKSHGYVLAETAGDADVILIMTCAIREGAEYKIWEKLKQYRSIKMKNKEIKKKLKIGVLGCMAERLGDDIIAKEKSVDLVAGPDSYRDLPRLLAVTEMGEKTINVLLSHDETYANIKPVTLSSNGISAYVSIMRGCNNMCTYCIVPFTRGKERSRDINSILEEVKYLSDKGVKDVTLLGQNVNSYIDDSEVNYAVNNNLEITSLAKGFKTKYKPKKGGQRFAELLDKVSLVNPEMRIRFTSPHPKDFPDEVLHIINERFNVCKCIHLPAQCGSSRILELMQRGYTRETYLELVEHIRSIIPSISLTSDFICGFCSETDEEFEETITMIQNVQYSICYMFPYSMREKTAAHKTLQDNVPISVKKNRMQRMSLIFREVALQLNRAKIGQRHLVLVQGPSKRSPLQLAGRNDGNTIVILPDVELPVLSSSIHRFAVPGDYVEAVVTDASSQVLKAMPVAISSMQEFYSNNSL